MEFELLPAPKKFLRELKSRSFIFTVEYSPQLGYLLDEPRTLLVTKVTRAYIVTDAYTFIARTGITDVYTTTTDSSNKLVTVYSQIIAPNMIADYQERIKEQKMHELIGLIPYDI